MEGRRAELTYLAAAVPMRFVSGGAGVALALAAAILLHDVGLGGALIAVLTAPSASGFWAKRVASRNGESAAACASMASSHSSPRNVIRRPRAGLGSRTRSS